MSAFVFVRCVAPIVLVAMLAACASVPVRELPQAQLQNTWSSAPAELAASEATALAWWNNFHDPVLDQLIELAQDRNLDLRLAEARIREARAQRNTTHANLLPQIDGSVQVERGVDSRNIATDTASVGGIASWEFDVFGRLRSEARAADAESQATEADRDAVRLALLAEVARSYVELRMFQVQTDLSIRNAQAQEETVRITRARFAQGMGSRLDVERTLATLRTTRAQIPQSRELAEAARHRLVLLVASTPAMLASLLPETPSQPPALPDSDALSVLLTPTQVIAQRPDVRAAERRLIAAAELHNVARALRYPRISLAGLLGVGDDRVGELLSSGTRTWSAGAGILTPLFDFGRIRAAIDAADARQEQAYLAYELTARTALQEAQTALVLYTEGKLRQQELAQAVESARTAARLARRQYVEGTLSLLEVLDAERSVYAAELDSAQATAEVSIRLVSVYQTLGIVPAPQQTGAGSG